MKHPVGKGSGNTGKFKAFVDAFNRIGEDEAVKRRSKLLKYRQKKDVRKLRSEDSSK